MSTRRRSAPSGPLEHTGTGQRRQDPGAGADGDAGHPAGVSAPAAGWWGSDRLVGSTILVVTVVGAAVSLVQLSHPGVLFGVSTSDFDTGSYFGAAVLLVHGHLPYRSFVLMHPPGMALVLSPVAALSSMTGTGDGIAICRLLMVGFVAADIFLVGRLVRHKGLLVTLIACSVVALQPDVFTIVRSVELEPLLVLFCLLGANVVFRQGAMTEGRAMALGGVLFGLAGAVKVWAVLPVLVVALLSVSKLRRRLAPFVAGAAGGFLVPSLPFMALAPAAFFRDVVTAQVGRFGTHRTPLVTRLVSMMGLHDLRALRSLGVPMAVVFVLLVLAGLLVRRTRPRPSSLDWFAAVTAGLIGCSFLVPEQYFGHYADFFVPFAAIALAVAADRLLGPRFVPAGVVVVAVLAFFLTLDAARYVPASLRYPSDVAAIEAHVPSGSCVVTDNTALTLAADRFVSTKPHCPTIADPFGTSVVEGSGLPLADGGPVPRRLTAFWLGAIERADYVVLTPHSQLRIPATTPITSYLSRHFDLSTYRTRTSTIQIYTRQYR
ncbi:MAG TPA: glycosyltransferase 87 family protein [Acidimicrobiales bacterium]|nr:glycosyltransferase 87 family protein [Acidimicrobiales bacterium]